MMKTSPYDAPSQKAFLKRYGVRIGSLVTCTLRPDAPDEASEHPPTSWRGWIIPPPQHRLSPIDADASSDDAEILYLMTEEGDGVGLSMDRIEALIEHGHRAPPAQAEPPPWALFPASDEPESHGFASRQGSLFAQFSRHTQTGPQETLWLIECGAQLNAYIAPPGPSSKWREALEEQWGWLGPLACQTATRADDSGAAWSPDGPVAQALQGALAQPTRGVVILHGANAGLAAGLAAWRETALPCPVICLATPGGDLAQRQDALQAALYAARYIDTGELLCCQEAPNDSQPASWRHEAPARRVQAPLGRYRLMRLFADPMAPHDCVATLSGGVLRLEVPDARPLGRPQKGQGR